MHEHSCKILYILLYWRIFPSESPGQRPSSIQTCSIIAAYYMYMQMLRLNINFLFSGNVKRNPTCLTEFSLIAWWTETFERPLYVHAGSII